MSAQGRHVDATPEHPPTCLHAEEWGAFREKVKALQTAVEELKQANAAYQEGEQNRQGMSTLVQNTVATANSTLELISSQLLHTLPDMQQRLTQVVYKTDPEFIKKDDLLEKIQEIVDEQLSDYGKKQLKRLRTYLIVFSIGALFASTVAQSLPWKAIVSKLIGML